MKPISIGKLRGLQQISSERGTITALALDHRQNLRKANPAFVDDKELSFFKVDVTAALAPQASAVLLDPEVSAAQAIASGAIPGKVGLVVAVESTGYTGDATARQAQIIPGWSVEKAKRMGASAIKLLVYYHPDSPTANEIEHFTANIAEDCLKHDLVLMLEPLSYSLEESKKLSSEEKRHVVVETARRLTPLNVDILKAEFPLDVNDMDESRWMDACREISSASLAPWILLSAAVEYATFLRQVTVACNAGASGIAVGRAVWKEAVLMEGRERRGFLDTVGRERLARLTSLCNALGKPLSEFYRAETPFDWYRKYEPAMRPASLLWAPPLYFLYYAAAATLLPFLVLYYEDLGLKGTQIGFLAGLPPLLSLISAPAWGVVSDKTKRRKLSLLLAIGGAVVLALVLAAVQTFAWLIPVVMLFSFFFSAIMPLVDSTTMSLLGGQKEDYGRIRVWGAVGWGIAAPVIGWLIATGGVTWSFWGYAGLMGLGGVIALGVPVGGQIEIPARGGVRSFLASPRWIIFLIVAFCGGMVLSMISNFLFIFLRELGADEFSLGLTLTVATLSELPVLFFSNRLLRRWSPQQLMGAALCFYALRALAYSFMASPWLALLIQLLHGPTFSLMWIAGVSYADRIAPAGLEATAQGLFSGVLLGVGAATGAFAGGWLYENIGPVDMFRLAALTALIGIGFMVLTEKRKHEHTL
jgi:tagatose-1,6-bisphosphate aldolase/MFS family permease